MAGPANRSRGAQLVRCLRPRMGHPRQQGLRLALGTHQRPLALPLITAPPLSDSDPRNDVAGPYLSGCVKNMRSRDLSGGRVGRRPKSVGHQAFPPQFKRWRQAMVRPSIGGFLFKKHPPQNPICAWLQPSSARLFKTGLPAANPLQPLLATSKSIPDVSSLREGFFSDGPHPSKRSPEGTAREQELRSQLGNSRKATISTNPSTCEEPNPLSVVRSSKAAA